MKRLLIIILAIASLLLVGCGNSTDKGSSLTENTTPVDEQKSIIKFVDEGVSDYNIIYANNSVDSDAAFRFASLLKKSVGVDLSPKKDTFVEAADREIVIGLTNREEHGSEEHKNLIADAYLIYAENERVFICAVSEEGYEAAFRYIFKEGLGIEDINDMKQITNATFALRADLDLFCAPSVQLKDNQTSSGDSYTVKGAKNAIYNYFVSDELLSYRFEKAFDSDFNTYCITYSSDTPVKGVIKYKLAGNAVTEEFYLEEGLHNTFTSFIDQAISGKAGAELSEIELSLLKGNEMAFRLEDISLSSRTLPSSDVVYIQDADYKLGIKLSWGGGVSYLEDLHDGDPSLGNLLNDHDTGRLIQQSYYGTNQAPYECGTYNNQQWGYNPVQGGDRYNNHSKLIDYSISEDGKSVYVKCRPLDWAKNNVMTPSYMENTYTLCGGYIKVDNRFTDFSGYTHRRVDQELPAFYTISYLSEFVCYTGSKAWTDDELTVKKDMSFWAGNSDAYISLNSKETWGAWCAPNGYGIGVFTPMAEILLAGRFQYNGSKNPGNNATNYVAPLIKNTMKSFSPFEYAYYITTGSIEEIRADFEGIAENN